MGQLNDSIMTKTTTVIAGFLVRWQTTQGLLVKGLLVHGLCFLGLGAIAASAIEPAKKPIENVADEALAEEFSLERAVQFMDDASVGWTQSRGCFTCHTNYIHLMAKPLVTKGWAEDAAHQQTRAELEKLVEERWVKTGPRWDAEVVMSAAVLAVNDAATTGKLHPTTQKALDRMWSVQRADGGFDWLKCGWPPMESDDDYGIAIAALALAAAPGYQETEPAQRGLEKLRSYLKEHAPPTLHHEAMLLWPARYGVQMLTEAEQAACLKKLLASQRSDGGWSAASLINWKRADGKEQSLDESDAYGTSFVAFVLQMQGSSGSQAASQAEMQASVERARTWLTTHQRASGRWHARSLNRDSKHFLSHAATGFAIMVLAQPK